MEFDKNQEKIDLVNGMYSCLVKVHNEDYFKALIRSDDVNMIRRRANKLDPNSPSKFDLSKNISTEQFLDSVVCERAWELCFEPDGRWFDIVRLELKDKISSFGQDVLYKVPLEYLTDDWYFYKVPIEDRQINPNFE
jgi:hypothetical protein